METFQVKDKNLAAQGHLQIEWASKHMPVLNIIKERFEKEKPLQGQTIVACLHVTKETAVLIKTLIAGGAKVALCGSNPLSTQDDVAAALADSNVHVFAWRGQNTEDYYNCIEKVLDFKPTITMDDGADVVGMLHSKRQNQIIDIKGGTEETSTGVVRLKAMEQDGNLKYPIIAVNDAYTKYLFDNRYGTGQSTIDGILRATAVLLAGKNFVVGGYGWCSRGIAMRAKGLGANVIVTEVQPTRALEAVMDGYRVMPMLEAAPIGDIFATATGDINVIRKEHMQKMKDGAIMCNSGHFNVEINTSELDALATAKRVIRPNMEEYTLKDGKHLYLLAEGRLVNLAAAEGHPSEVMDMSFANQALCAEYIAKNTKLKTKVYIVPKELDEKVAELKLKNMGVTIDELTEEQKKYLSTWEMGTT
ncbi:MAG: adenosylhomocysteinase [Nitrososphaerota archaeon]|jgi:adenosylhomocysteinase|uniref:adenosylhomocysteinase n=1 Tax=Candidatus Bathycorpusculum sp. TaxID=2994959 RepID=UPI00281F1727|nr:adenosylhomocysteinase [Candidatus Termiticorpusculum sp.]MCL2257876.1 adenosylhomocysteinase [Candidatus Termiticorpusculum sp.]MCL2292004.1 adenosylhomocysteinase [Candidatus Termiticorpusculum sp.]MDR0460867.1 adenosylhomocysteinase [Nitrososphaerota archaeon]